MPWIFVHLLFLLVTVTAFPVAAAAPQIIIRDTEIEAMIKEWTAPVIRAAELDPEGVKIILVQSPDLNAFVAGGQNIFIYTGLLQKTDHPDEVIGVIAHELGHIAGGHLVRGRTVMENASYESMLGTILGIGVAVITGSGEAGVAISSGAQGLAQRKFLAFSRTQESSADQAALRFMDRAAYDAGGLDRFMQKLVDQEVLPVSQQSEYMRTHPLSRDRVEAITAARTQIGGKITKPWPKQWIDGHTRMKAKLLGFITPEQVSWVYPDNDQTVAADYARAIADYRKNNVQRALTRIDSLVTREPRNPYFHELKGQMLFDFGRVAASVAPYARASELAGDAPLIDLAYAQSLMSDTRASEPTLTKAVQILERVRTKEPRHTRTYRLLATLYGRMNNDGAAQAALAEESFLRGSYPESRRLAQGAVTTLPKNAAAYRRVMDLLADLDRLERKEKND